jgi:hypothetical protein
VHTYPDINTFLLLTEGVETTGESQSVNTTDQEGTGFDLYPNPASTELFLKSDEIPSKAVVHIFDIQGRNVLQEPYREMIDISNLRHGVYIVKIVSDNFVAERKFVKTY